MSGPKIQKAGNDPDCIHFEDIVGLIGTCWKCGQVKDYRPKPEKVSFTFLTDEERELVGAGPARKRAGSASDESATWAGIHATAKRAYRKRGEV